jgi:DNA-binding response OmpR family regulator
VKLPDGDGHEILKGLKLNGKTAVIPVFLMSGYRLSPPQMAQIIDDGAEQYVTKPFAPEVLRAYAGRTLKSNIPSKPTIPDEICRCGIKMCPTERKVCYKNREIHLSPIEFDIFFALLERSPAVVSRDALLAKVWGEDGAATDGHSLEVYISRLKKKLSPDLGGRIAGVYKAGYKFSKDGRATGKETIPARRASQSKTLRKN